MENRHVELAEDQLSEFISSKGTGWPEKLLGSAPGVENSLQGPIPVLSILTGGLT